MVTARLPLSVFVSSFLISAVISTATLAQNSQSLKELREQFGINADGSQISISGVSAGGWLANQYHIAYSSKIMGAGILAAGPYHCAGSPGFICKYTPYAAFYPYGSCQAMHVCSRMAANYYGIFGFYFGPPNAADSVTSTLQEAERGGVDPISGLKNDRVWIFTGGHSEDTPHDRLVPHEVVLELKKYYEALFARPEVGNAPSSVHFVDTHDVDHFMVVSRSGANSCDRFGLPFINDCDYNAAENLLNFIYPERPSRGNVVASGDLLAFDQTPFFAAADSSLSMNAKGHIYVPQTCRNGTSCPLHIALHGCDQQEQLIDLCCRPNQTAIPEECEPLINKRASKPDATCESLYFFRDSGYNEWAEEHGVIILYPQADAYGSKSSNPGNPHACWDWWGYSGPDYFRKTGAQIQDD